MSEESSKNCSEWKASQDRMPPNPSPVKVSGKCEFPTAGYEVKLTRAVPQGINPRILILEKTVIEPESGATIVTTVDVNYTDDTTNEYDQVDIRGEVTLDVEVYH